ncbi:MAG: nucleotidyltransferase family protein [Nitrospirae bacterium]|nr:nucleotidyltransferase family protein [Nitrospirota bacterium]
MKTVQTKNDVSNILSSHREEIERFGVKRIGLFGSFVKGKQKKGSDVDLLVEFIRGKKNFKNFIYLAFFLEDLLHRKVELITHESMSPYLKPYILKEIKYVL